MSLVPLISPLLSPMNDDPAEYSVLEVQNSHRKTCRMKYKNCGVVAIKSFLLKKKFCTSMKMTSCPKQLSKAQWLLFFSTEGIV